jgi:hypothetical protein
MTTPKIDPELALALALYNTPGAYALLLGSGVSRAAGVPTGWEVVEDLIRRVARLTAGAVAESPAFEPGPWYREKFGSDASYTALLEQLAATPAERRSLLRQYFEPADEERQQGLKLPTKAHRAIAKLVAGGFVRVIITTNFDQLTETAIRDEGVSPTVVSTDDAIAGMIPLHLSPATVIKVHGDYLDTRIRNTVDELADYTPALDALLDRIFDEYGLIVAGWSGSWDTALRAAIERAPNRRFTTFWAQHREAADEAKRLIEHRRAVVIPVDGADGFFGRVVEKTGSLTELGRPHPMSVAVAVATAKRYLAQGSERIRLSDLLADEANRTVRALREIIPQDRGLPTFSALADEIPKMDAASETMTALMAATAYWAEPHHRPLIVSALERVAAGVRLGGDLVWTTDMYWQSAFLYPAQRSFYAAGIAALARGGFEGEGTLESLMYDPVIRIGLSRPAAPPFAELHAGILIDGEIGETIAGQSGELRSNERASLPILTRAARGVHWR